MEAGTTLWGSWCCDDAHVSTLRFWRWLLSSDTLCDDSQRSSSNTGWITFKIILLPLKAVISSGACLSHCFISPFILPRKWREQKAFTFLSISRRWNLFLISSFILTLYRLPWMPLYIWLHMWGSSLPESCLLMYDIDKYHYSTTARDSASSATNGFEDGIAL